MNVLWEVRVKGLVDVSVGCTLKVVDALWVGVSRKVMEWVLLALREAVMKLDDRELEGVGVP